MKFTILDARRCLELLKRLGLINQPYDIKQVKDGMNVELEHSDITGGDPILTCRIALAHLRENPNYYKLLKTVDL